MSLSGSIASKREIFIGFNKKGKVEVSAELGDLTEKILSVSIIDLIKQEVMYHSIKPMAYVIEDVDNAGIDERGIARLRLIQTLLHEAQVEITNIIKKQGNYNEN